MAEIVFSEYQSIGLGPHLHKMKTAVIFGWHGPDVQEARRQCQSQVELTGGIPFTVKEKKLVLPIGGKYKHLGSWSREDGKPCTDIAVKMACMRRAAQRLKRHVICNPAIAKPVRLGVAHTHVMPTGEYSAGAWASMTQVDQARLHRTAMDVDRMVDGSQRASPQAIAATGIVVKKDVEIMRGLEVMSPRCRNSYARIRVLCLVLEKKRTELLALLVAGYDCEKSCLKVVVSDLSWAATVVPKLGSMAGASVAGWVKHIIQFRAQTLLAMKERFAQWSARPTVEAAAEPIQRQVTEGVWRRRQCGIVKDSGRAFANHMRSEHGIGRAARRKV